VVGEASVLTGVDAIDPGPHDGHGPSAGLKRRLVSRGVDAASEPREHCDLALGKLTGQRLRLLEASAEVSETASQQRAAHAGGGAVRGAMQPGPESANP
jgi:hypothetical protein